MPGPALTVSIEGDTSDLDAALSDAPGRLSGFTDTLKGLIPTELILENIGTVAGALLDIGGPEAKQALSDLGSTLGTALQPVMEKLGPLIVKLVEGFAGIVEAVSPVLIPALSALVDILGGLFDAVGTVLDVLNDLWHNVLEPLVNTILNALWEKLDAVRGMFDLVGQIITAVTGFFQPLLDAINAILGPIGSLLGTVGDLIGDLGEALGLSHDVAESGSELQNISGGSFGAPAPPAIASVTIHTGADPSAVVRSIRRYAAANGGARAFTRNVTGLRGR